MRPAFLDNMSWEMAEVYGAVTDQILINLAHYFPYYDARKFPRSSITYQADMLAQMGQVNRDTMAIIRRNLKGVDKYLNAALEQVIVDSVAAVNPDLANAVAAAIFKPAGIPAVSPNQMRAFTLYYKQAADKLNLVNTVMLESTRQAYQTTVADIVNRVQVTQTALDIGAGETITGASTWNQATQHAIDRMAKRGITGFIDHGGHRWSAEAYVAMDIRTTMFNTGRAAVWETNENFGNDLYQVSYHNGARPLCYPWQNKVISSTNNARVVADLDGYEVQVHAQSETSYGQAAGLFGVNCKHYPTPFIPGVSIIRGEPQDEADNARTYAESQEQRRLERKLREEKRDLMMAKARGVPDDQLAPLRERCRQSSADIEDFCNATGRARHRDREGVYTERKFPAANTYDVKLFETQQKEMIERYFKHGGTQRPFTFGQMTPNVPLTAKPRPVAQAAPQPALQSNPQYGKPFEDQGYRKPQLQQFADAQATLDAAPEDARKAWEKVSGKLNAPDVGAHNTQGAHYNRYDKRTHFKTYKEAFDESTYQRKNNVFFHEYGHNLDNLFGGGGTDPTDYLSVQYKNGVFGQTIAKECESTVTNYYLHKHGFADAYDAVKAAQNGTGGMGFGSYVRQALRGTMPSAEYRAIRSTLLAAGDDDSVLRPLADKWLKPLFEKELTAMVHRPEVGKEFCDWVRTTYDIYKRGDISDMFERYTATHYGIEFPFGVGHGTSYALQTGSTEKEAFAEMYSAYVTGNDSLPVIQQFFPESFKVFTEMLGSVI